jgi:hypothetical protein
MSRLESDHTIFVPDTASHFAVYGAHILPWRPDFDLEPGRVYSDWRYPRRLVSREGSSIRTPRNRGVLGLRHRVKLHYGVSLKNLAPHLFWKRLRLTVAQAAHPH